MLIGYARVSTDDQNLDLQRDALQKACCDKIYTDQQAVSVPTVQGWRLSWRWRGRATPSSFGGWIVSGVR